MRPLAFASLLLVALVQADWDCVNTTVVSIGRIPGSATWTSTVCQGKASEDPFGVGPLRFNIVDVDLYSRDVRFTPLMASANSSYLQTINGMAAPVSPCHCGRQWRLFLALGFIELP